MISEYSKPRLITCHGWWRCKDIFYIGYGKTALDTYRHWVQSHAWPLQKVDIGEPPPTA